MILPEESGDEQECAACVFSVPARTWYGVDYATVRTSFTETASDMNASSSIRLEQD